LALVAVTRLLHFKKIAIFYAEYEGSATLVESTEYIRFPAHQQVIELPAISTLPSRPPGKSALGLFYLTSADLLKAAL
jgi:hypothetical protein